MGVVKPPVGELINFAERQADRSRPSRGPAAFFFALGCPISYLAAERVERALGEIEWVPIHGVFTDERSESERVQISGELLELAEREAEALRLPLIAPAGAFETPRELLRAAVFATDEGVGARFSLAASRFLFCGGYEAGDPQVIVQAAIAAGLAPERAVAAGGDPGHDRVLDATAQGLRSRGVIASPAIRIGKRWFEGLDAVPGATSFTHARALYGGPAV